MALGRRIARTLRGLRERQRRTWAGPERVWIELRELRNGDQERVVAELSRRLELEPGVRWARFNGRWQRLVVSYDAALTDLERIVDRVDAFEDELGYGHLPLSHEPRRHPADVEPLRRAVAEVGVEAASIAAGLALRLSSARVRARHVDLAAITTALRGVPRLRRMVERQVGPRAAELVLESADALTRAMMQGSSGAAVDIVHHALEIRERRARRQAWERWEPVLAADPDAHPRTCVVQEDRIADLPDGPVEHYVDRALLASLGAFAFGLATTGDAEVATAPLFGGIPKPARVGRTSFVRQLAMRFARAGVLVQRAEALSAMDRADALVVDGTIAERPEVEPVLVRARDLGMRVVVYGEGDEARLPVDQVVSPRALRNTIRRLQVDGHVVVLVSYGDSTALPLADIGLGIADGVGVPWAADLVAHDDLEVLALLVGAVDAARVAARHAVWLAGAEAITSMVMALGGVRRQALRHILEVTNLATLLALADGVRLVEGIGVDVPEVPAAGSPWHRMEVDEVLAALESRAEGLRREEADARRPPRPATPSEVRRFASSVRGELDNPLTPVLAGGAGLSALVGSPIDAAMVLSVIGLNGLVGGIQRYRTERALEALTRPEDQLVYVLRGGDTDEVAASDLVKGDVVALRAGDAVPADLRILVADGLEADESSLTGESLPVAKTTAPTDGPLPSDRASMLYQGTTIAAGRAVGVVVALGEATESNRALRLEHRKAPRGVEARLESLTDLTVPVAAVAAVALLGAGVLRREPPEELVGDAVGLAVASVPEGLPVLATMAQLSAARRLGRRGALVRRPRAVEALGRMQVLCADKTGTLTEGRLRLGAVSDGRRAHDLDELDARDRAVLAVGLRASPVSDERPSFAHLTDQAVVDGARRLGIEESDGAEDWTREEELPFEPSRSYAATVGRIDGRWALALKGSPEAILARCGRQVVDGEVVDLGEADRRELVAHAEVIARRGYRVLAVADRLGGRRPKLTGDLDGLTFRGFLGLVDPVRASARDAVAELRRAGVEVRVVTGDHPQTALAVAEALELPCEPSEVLTGDELERLDEETLAERIREVVVYARVTPSHKVRIVRALQRAGLAVGMTGDGANDAPAIQLADVGIALGENATAAARDAADLIVADGRIETIVHAVTEGRKLWVSVRDAVSVLIGGNIGEIGFTLMGGLLTGRPTLNTRQLLLVNLFTDAVPAMVIAMMSPSGISGDRLLQEGPDRSLDARLTRDIAWRAAVTAGSATAGWAMARSTGSRRCADTVGLLSIVGTQLGQTLLVGHRSPMVVGASLLSMGGLLAVVETPGVSRFFGCRPLGPIGLTQAGLAVAGGTGVSMLVPVTVRWLEPRLRGWARREHLRDQEWVRLVAESRAASLVRDRVDRLREVMGAEPEAATAK